MPRKGKADADHPLFSIAGCGNGASPRIPDEVIARHPKEAAAPAAHTAAELAQLLRLLRLSRTISIAIGHGRDPASRSAAGELAREWETSGGTVLAVIDWPANAASWLRPAQRLTRVGPDAWVIADNPAGTAQLGRRLANQQDWSASRTLGFASVANDNLATLACLFRFGNSNSNNRNKPYTDITLHSGDAFVFGDQARFVYHGVPKINPGTADPATGLDTGRINITMRVTGLHDQ